MDLWVLQDYTNDHTWTRRLRIIIDLPWSPGWAMNAAIHGKNNVILVQDYSGLVAVLYDLTEKRVLKRIEFANDGNNHVHLTQTMFRDSLQRHTFFKPQDTTRHLHNLIFVSISKTQTVELPVLPIF